MSITLVINSIWQALKFALHKINTNELFVSPTPYSMKGLIYDARYASVHVPIKVFTIILVCMAIHSLSRIWGTGIISYEFRYLLSVLLCYCWKVVQEPKDRICGTK